MRVFAIWEPILPTDWSQPATSVLDRLNDDRVRQFWDTDHLMATVLKQAELAGVLHAECCERKGFLWDLTAAYAPGALWRESLPEPILLNGPVVKTASALDAVVARFK